ncbi:MAG: hypothetical protein NZO16_03380 [Deltaproteobacteria bacterium]|nr:hypothetical protein [Deltaproteobacteria bacterium]
MDLRKQIDQALFFLSSHNFESLEKAVDRIVATLDQSLDKLSREEIEEIVPEIEKLCSFTEAVKESVALRLEDIQQRIRYLLELQSDIDE